jgi:hypothetical protein
VLIYRPTHWRRQRGRSHESVLLNVFNKLRN